MRGTLLHLSDRQQMTLQPSLNDYWQHPQQRGSESSLSVHKRVRHECSLKNLNHVFYWTERKSVTLRSMMLGIVQNML